MAYNYPINLDILASSTASSSANLAFTSKISSNYNTYYAAFYNILPATNNVNFQVEVSTDNGSTWLSTNYRYMMEDITSVTHAVTDNNSTGTTALIANAVSSTSTSGLNGNMYFWGLNSAVQFTGCGMFSHYNQVPNYDFIDFSISNTTTTAITAIRFSFSSGNIASGTIKFYGVKEP